MTDRRGRKVPDIYFGADRTLSRLQKWPYRIESSVLHDQDHDGCRQYLRQHCVFELIGEMLRQHTQRERSFRSQGYLAHSVVSCLANNRSWRGLQQQIGRRSAVAQLI